MLDEDNPLSEISVRYPFPDEGVDHLHNEIRRLEARIAELEELARRDCLLGIPNRRSFFESLANAIAEVGRDGVSYAMLFIDLNRLKEINDTFGHNAGDQALIAVVRLMGEIILEDGCIARLGGDEFGILLKHRTEQNACRTASRICAAVNRSALRLRGSCVPLGISIGVTMIQAGDIPKEVVERADKEMYRMKSQLRSERKFPISLAS